MKKISKSILIVTVIILTFLWLASGIYTLKSDGGEQAVVTRFGEFDRVEKEWGLKWHIPSPIERVEVVRAEEIKSLELGYFTTREGSPYENARYESNTYQSLMLTRDENLVNTETVIQYKIGDVKDYLFNVDDQESTLGIAAESVLRRVVANHDLDDVLTINKSIIQNEVKKDLQDICDYYAIGIDIINVNLQEVYAPVQVDDAFKDVINAREDKNRFINEAEKIANEIIPRARGNAAELLNRANAYKEKRIAEAKGDVANFVQVLEKYEYGKEVTKTRLYLETLEDILPGIKKYILDSQGNTLNVLPLDDGIMK